MTETAKHIIIDTNVLVTANNANTGASDEPLLFECEIYCYEEIRAFINEKRILLLDAGREILLEYGNNLKKYRPGIGNVFFKEIHSNIANPKKVIQVLIKKEGYDYCDFPNHNGLINFDPSDRKFIAVAVVFDGKCEILQAVDSKWWGWKKALNECGVKVKFICKDYQKDKYDKKIGRKRS